jgi:hypothetical protein
MKNVTVISIVMMICPHIVNSQHMNLFVMKTPSKKLNVLASLIHVGRLVASLFQLISKSENFFAMKLTKRAHH